MKKTIFTIVMILAAAVSAVAQETVKTLYAGEPKEVTWDNTLAIPAEDFAEGVNVGQYIYITFSQTTDVIEIKSDGTWLPGSRFTMLGDNAADFRAYITADMLAALKAHGLEICGAKFTVTGVSVCNDGFVMPAGAIWGGYFWVDGQQTLELFKTAFASYGGQRYMDIYLSDDKGDYTGYTMSVSTQASTWADNAAITHTAQVATVDLQNIDVAGALADVNTLNIRCGNEGGSPFNITAVALRSENGPSTGVTTVEADNNGPVDVYNLQGIKLRTSVPAAVATDNLPKGIYLVGGKKILVK